MIPSEHESSPEPITTSQAVRQLKLAQAAILVSPMEWESEDGIAHYSAAPYQAPNQDSVDLATLPDLPLWHFERVLNTWELTKVTTPDINNEITADHFLIRAGMPLLHTSHTVSAEIVEESEEKLEEILSRSLELQDTLGLNMAELSDYFSLSEAIGYLRGVSESAWRANYERQLNMTEEEARWERMRKYEYLHNTTEIDKNAAPRWWSVSEGGLLWTAYSATPEEAIIMIEDERGGIPMFPFFFIEVLSEEGQAELTTKLAGQKVARLIPFSTEPWPEDSQNMTESQKTALERLKPS